jgi:hypothetical protein
MCECMYTYRLIYACMNVFTCIHKVLAYIVYIYVCLSLCVYNLFVCAHAYICICMYRVFKM